MIGHFEEKMRENRPSAEAEKWRMTKDQVSVDVIRPAVFARGSVTKVRLPFSHRGWEIEALSFLMITFQKNPILVLAKRYLCIVRDNKWSQC